MSSPLVAFDRPELSRPKGRGTLTIDLNAVVDNYRSLQKMSGKAETAAVVKANAYGLGVHEIGPSLYRTGCKTFFVATLAEGIELRFLIPDHAVTIYILNGLNAGQEQDFIEHHLIPVLNTMESVGLWRHHAAHSQQRLPAAIHIDTGLNRLGLQDSETTALLDDPSQLDGIDPVLVMSHLACADEPNHPLTDLQYDRFSAHVESFKKVFPTIKTSLAASDGMFRGKRMHFDLTRPGAALYGLKPTVDQENVMKQVVFLDAPVMQIRTVEQDGTVGYGATAHVRQGQRLATIGLGYADGMLRSISNKGKFYFSDAALPIVGRVSMDVTIVDISALPDNIMKQGDRVEVMGVNQSPNKLARDAGTIGWEILTSLSDRFHITYTS